MTRKLLRSIGVGLVGMLLFAQMAIAAYMCPGLSPAKAMNLQSMTSPSLDGRASSSLRFQAGDQVTNCDEMAGATAMTGATDVTGAMDPASANLCAEHCRFGQQSDQTPTLEVPATLLRELYTTPLQAAPAAPSWPTAAGSNALAAVSPPHAILHCCFRI
jgi:hypothetical protein